MLSVIVNPAAGGGRPKRSLPAVRAELTRLGLEHEVHATTSLAHAKQLASQTAAEGKLPVAFGGDGLVGAVAGALAHNHSAMGVLPGGRGNDLARVLGLPRDPVRACAVLSADHERTIDIGLAGKRPFVGIASCGYDSHANRIANAATRLPAQLVYLYGGLGALARWRPADFQVTADGQTRELRGYTVAVANSSTYGNGMRIAPDASMEDGHFDVILISDMARARFLLHLGEVFAGTHTRLREVEVLRAQSVSITASEPFALYADGDVLAELPATLEIDPAAVRVRVPA